MLETLRDLLQLPYQTLAIIGGGYLAYRLAYTGRDGTHQTIDTAAIVLVFAFVSQAAAAALLVWYSSKSGLATDAALPLIVGYTSSLFGIIIVLVVAAIWRVFGMSGVAWGLRQLRVSSADRNFTAWESIISDERSLPSQIKIVRTDGSEVMCDRLADWKDSPFGPMILGHDGSVALYVTSKRTTEDDEWKDVAPQGGEWGPEITIVPAHQIHTVRLRHPGNEPTGPK